MEYIKNTNYFTEDWKNHEGANLSDFVFKGLDYRFSSQPVSFFRSDFSRSRFDNCAFKNNLFGRADFIDVCIENSSFDSVNFGSCLFKNAFLDKVQFQKNHYHGVAVQCSTFRNCVFRNELFVTNMRQCDFYECTFINCKFEKSYIDENTFINCELIKVDISECIADELRFDNCTLTEVYLCANLWAGYFYKKTNIYNFGFKYRGKIVDIWNDDCTSFLNTLYGKGLYPEFVNSILVARLKQKEQIIEIIKDAFQKIMKQPAQIRKNAMLKLLHMLSFYFDDQNLPLDVFLPIYSFLENYNWENTSFEESLLYQAEIYKLRTKIEKMNFHVSYVRNMKPDILCFIKFHLNMDTKEEAVQFVEKIFSIANSDYCLGAFPEPLFSLISVEDGSVILTLATSAILAVLISFAAKHIAHNLNSIRIEQCITKNIMRRLTDSQVSLAEIQKSCNLAQKFSLLSTDSDLKQLSRLSSELTKGAILDIIIHFLV